MKFGRLTVLARNGSKRYGKASFSNWYCSCECGEFSSVIGSSLMSGDTRSCGCLLKESSRQRCTDSYEDLTDQCFGELVVVARASKPGAGRNVKWLCACSCGGLTILAGNSIKSGSTVSCGCKAFQGKRFRPEHITLKSRIHGARRRAAEIAATRPFDKELFDLIELEAYSLAQMRTLVLGEEWAVDHIVPLKSPIVCGLHNEYNLAVITRSANSSKRNRHWPDMP